MYLRERIAQSAWCAVSVLSITFLSVLPQLQFWISRGSNWQGAYIVLQPDEVLYSAYVNSIIDGRPRRNDPTTGRNDYPNTPMSESSESLFSVQFIPPMITGYLARWLGTSASSAFIALLAVSGLVGSLAVYLLILFVCRDAKIAAVGTLVVFSFGAMIAGQGLVGLLFKPETKFLGFPFLRRYEPAVPFSLFFAFCSLSWLAITDSVNRSARIKAMFAGITFTILIFSYLYLWTGALAWVVCFFCLWTVLGENRKQDLLTLAIGSFPVFLGFLFYAYLLSHLPSSITNTQVLTYTHRPDLLRPTEVLGICCVLVLVWGIRASRVSTKRPETIFTFSFCLLPLLLFNQQVVTGRSIQPFHYEVFIGNYVVLLAVVFTMYLLTLKMRRRTAMLVVAFCILWAAVEVELQFHANSELATLYDEMVPVLLALKTRATQDGTWKDLLEHGKTNANVFSPTYGISTILPTWAPQPSLLAPGAVSFQDLSVEDRTERLFLHLYFCGRSSDYVGKLLSDSVNDRFFSHFAKVTIFGPERVVTFLESNFKAIRPDEITREMDQYEEFSRTISLERVRKYPLTYVIAENSSQFDSSNLDRWYVRDQEIRVGAYTLYHLTKRD